MSCRYVDTTDKTHFFMRLRSIFGREYEKPQILKQLFWKRYLVCIILNSTLLMVFEW